MTPQTRREFLKKSGWMVLGSLLVPYIPKTFYSIPAPVEISRVLQDYTIFGLPVYVDNDLLIPPDFFLLDKKLLEGRPI